MIPIEKRPSIKYWTQTELVELKNTKSYPELAQLAIRIILKMPTPRIEICGPLSTGGKGSFEENVKEFDNAIMYFSQKGDHVFDQMFFESKIAVFCKECIGYDERILDEFYFPIFESNLIEEFRFLPNFSGSHGATGENDKLIELKRNIIYLKEDWYTPI